MRRVLFTASAVIRTPCNTGRPTPPPLPLPEPRPSSDAELAPAAAAVVAPEEPVPAPNPDPEPDPNPDPVPFPEELRGPNPPEDEDGFLVFRVGRSLAIPYAPDPGASWFSALSSRLPPEDPPNISVSTRAIWRASPYFTR